MSYCELRKLIRSLQATFPTLHPVRVKRCRRIKDWGDCSVVTHRRTKVMQIRVAAWLPWPADYLVFVHEYGHARVWQPDHIEEKIVEQHPAEWGVKLAELWRHLEGEDTPPKETA